MKMALINDNPTQLNSDHYLLQATEIRGRWHLEINILPNVGVRFILQNKFCNKSMQDLITTIRIFTDTYAKKIKFLKKHAHKNFSANKSFTIHSIDTLKVKINDFIQNEFIRVERALTKRREQKLYEEIIAEKPYHDFMYASPKPRKVTCYIAPTNAGKSYHARETMLNEINPDDGRSIILLPLRALAIENHTTLSERGVPTSLITGEERHIDPCCDVICQTVETFDSAKEYNTIMLDEAQLTFTPERGAAYLESIVLARCNHLILTAAPESRSQIESLFFHLGESVAFIELDRLCPLVALPAPLTIKELKPGDLVIAFSTKKIHALAKEISARGFKVGTLYGAMSPSARRHMMQHYHEGKIDIMVSTDAIGMGANFPVDRCLFSENQKFDGETVRELTVQEMKQIAGRAGRYGLKNKGLYGSLVGFFDHDDFYEELVEAVESEPIVAPLEKLYALPNKEAFRSSPLSLERTLHAWINATCEGSDLYEKNQKMMFEFKSRCHLLQDNIKKGIISKEDGINLLFVAINIEKHAQFFNDIIVRIHDKSPIKISISEGVNLQDLEESSELLAVVAQVQRLYPEFSETEDIIVEKQAIVGRNIYTKLIEMYA
jgi:hypothetical protein